MTNDSELSERQVRILMVLACYLTLILTGLAFYFLGGAWS